MGVEMSVDVYGVRDALKELGQLDKKYRFQAQNRIKAAGAEIVRVAQEAYPDTPTIQGALSGWSQKGRLGYDKTKVDKGVQIKIGGKSYGNAYALVTLVSSNPGASLFEVAGMNNGNSGKPGGPDRLNRKRQPIQSQAFIDALTAAYGKAQRGIWRRHKAIYAASEGALMEALRDVVAQVNRKLVES